jgi:6-pyruvoyl-tetrahydropterin synthase
MAFSALLIATGALGGSSLLAYMGGTIAQNVAKYFLYYDEFETQKVNPSDLRVGDHIFVPGSSSRGLKITGLVGYYHHGIYLGLVDGKHMVTDFGAVKNSTRPVIRKFDEFLGGYSNQLYRRNYKVQSNVLAPEKTLEYATLICNGKQSWPAYSLNTNNCEHYASLLKMAQVYSSQAKHLPQDLLYRQMVIPNKGKSILKQYTDGV